MGFEDGNGWICDHRGSLKFQGLRVPQEPDPFYYDYDTVQTVGMTLATILFLLGILIIISKKVKCRKADSRSERSGSSGERGERGGSSLGCRGTSLTEGPQGPPTSFPESLWLLDFLTLFSLVFASTAQHANPVSRSFPPQPLEVAACKTSPGHLHFCPCLSAEA
uniref:FXYD domain-containing ion transport regulator n=1 Tax=Ursus maritimus TaxID=29073 RepID=A0A452UWG6_URSMA